MLDNDKVSLVLVCDTELPQEPVGWLTDNLIAAALTYQFPLTPLHGDVTYHRCHELTSQPGPAAGCDVSFQDGDFKIWSCCCKVISAR